MLINPEWTVEIKEKHQPAKEETTNEWTHSQQSEIDFEEFKNMTEKSDYWDIMVKIAFHDRNKYLDYNPRNLNELKEQVKKLFDISKDSTCKWSYFYFDSHYDRVDISHTRDLKLAYKLNLHIHSKVLKIYVWDDGDELPEFTDLHGMQKSIPLIQNNFQNDVKRQANDTSWTISTPDENNQQVADWENISKPSLPTNPPIQKVNLPIPQEIPKPVTINDQFKTLQSLSAEDLNTLNEIKHGIVEQLKKNINTSKDDIVKELKKIKKFLSLIDTHDFFIQHIYTETRKKLFEIQSKQQSFITPPVTNTKQEEVQAAFDIKNFKTIRNTSFGRMLVEVNDGENNFKLNFLVSDFEIQILRTNQDDGQNVYIEFGLTAESGDYKSSLNLYIYDWVSKIYMPIGHWLLNWKCKAAYITALNWYKKELGTFFRPKMLFCDFDYELYEAIKTAFSNIQVSVLFNRLTKGLYDLANQFKLFEDNVVTDRVKALILCLKWASLSPPGKVKENFDKIRVENNSNFSDIKEKYDWFMDHFESNFTSSFKQTDWWNQSHAKLVWLEQIKILSKTDEVLCQIYASLIPSCNILDNSSNSNLFSFLKVLQWLENTIKSSLFDKIKTTSEEKIFGNIPFTKNIDYLMEWDYAKILNFEESNDDLYDSQEVLESFGFKSQSKKAKEIVICPSINKVNLDKFERTKEEEFNDDFDEDYE